MDSSTLQALETAEIELMARQRAFVEALRLSLEMKAGSHQAERDQLDRLLRQVSDNMKGIDRLSAKWHRRSASLAIIFGTVYLALGIFIGLTPLMSKTSKGVMAGLLANVTPYLPITGIALMGAAILAYALVGSTPREPK